jgi:nicotinamide-nucleotide amidase
VTLAATPALARALGEALSRRGWRAVTAESCTGGMVAAAITDIPGSSAWFERGFVTYSNEAKQSMLGVPAAVLEQHGAVSEPTARAMIAGALAASLGDVAVAVTGVAGPGGGTVAKPVGMVCFAWGARGAATVAVTHNLPGDRAAVRAASVAIALQGMLALANA